MPKFTVYGIGTYSLPSVVIEATSSDEAEEIFWNDYCDTPILCHHCARYVDISDVTDVQVDAE